MQIRMKLHWATLQKITMMPGKGVERILVNGVDKTKDINKETDGQYSLTFEGY